VSHSGIRLGGSLVHQENEGFLDQGVEEDLQRLAATGPQEAEAVLAEDHDREVMTGRGAEDLGEAGLARQ
jgi:hypothetical protein